MPLNIPALKIIFFIVSSFVMMSHSIATAADTSTDIPTKSRFNPFTLADEFKNTLNSKAILKTTKYFASGYTFQIGQRQKISDVKPLFEKSNYRERTASQTITTNDFILITQASNCAELTQTNISPDQFCVYWKNSDQSENLIAVTGETISGVYTGSPLSASIEAELNPILVAQYRNNEPVMQDEKKIANIPVQCLNAVIAIEDNDFLDHSGVSYSGLARAFIKNIVKMRKAQGGSTITQQLVKNYFLSPEKTLIRKAKELYMAIKLESLWTKDEILQTYLNIIYMGQAGAFQIRGFSAASQSYFAKPIEKLNLPECALLAAIINNPGQNHPWRKTEKSRARRNLVLTKMKDLNLISETEFNTSLDFPMPNPVENKATETAPYFFDAVRAQANELGIEIEDHSFYTSLNLTFQDSAQKSLQSGIQAATEKKTKLKSNKEKGLSLQGVIMTAQNTTGYVSAFVGGQNYRQTQFNRALNSRRQIGSLVKPIVYLSGLAYGLANEKNVTPTTVLTDQYFEWIFDKKKWAPENYDKKFRGEVPYYYALKESLNSPTVQVAYQVGIQPITETAKKLGITSKLENIPSTSLGASSLYPIEVLQAYTTLAKFGLFQKLSFIKKIQDSDGQTIYQHTTAPEQTTDRTKTAILVGMMKQTLISGTAKSATAYGFTLPAAGKTGTTSNGNDAWFAGFTPYLTTVVWLGFDQNVSTYLTGASGAVPIWAQHMKKMSEQFNPTVSSNDFIWPETTEIKKVESESVNETVDLVFEK
jgi:penicillin-binding protein 1B